MSSFYQSIVKVISKPSEKRDDEEINMILGWFMNLFKKKAAVFGDIKPEVVKDIIKNCAFETKKPDDIVIRQGDVGDCFYINLRGKVSIYINHKKHDENDTIDDVPSKSIDDSGDHAGGSDNSKSKKLRERLGNFVTSLGSGEGFGEIALVSEELRTASIICDEMTDLVIVNKALYNRSLHASTLRKLNEKQSFINRSPFFGNWAPKMKKLLSLCLERDIIPYDSYLGKQGESADRIYFIISGQAKVTVNPNIHQMQYPRMYPLKLPENECKEIISSWMDEKNASSGLVADECPIKATKSATGKNALLKRRNVTFAQAEQQLKTRSIEVGILGPGEISGMCEILFDMPTFMQSTKCLEDCDVFYIYKRSYERLIAKRNPTCISKMKENVLMKLAARNSRLRSSMPIDLFRSLQYRLQLANAPRRSEFSDEAKSTSPSNPRTGPMLPPGPIIQSNVRPRSAAYRRMLRLARQYKERIAQNAAAKMAPNSVSTANIDIPLDDLPSKVGTNRSTNSVTESAYSSQTNAGLVKIVPIGIVSQSQLSGKNKASLSQLVTSNNSTFSELKSDDYYQRPQEVAQRKMSAGTASSLPQIVGDLNNSNQDNNANNSSISNEFYSSSESYEAINNNDYSMTTASGTNNSNSLSKSTRATQDLNQLSEKNASIFESNAVQEEAKPKDKSDEALELLESRMKRWHVELGEKKPTVTKLYRIDYEKLKNEVSIKGSHSFSRALLNPSLEIKVAKERSFHHHHKQHSLSGSGDSASVSTNSPDLNSPLSTPENEHVDLASSFSNYVKLSNKQQQLHARLETRLFPQRDSSSLGSSSPKTTSTATHLMIDGEAFSKTAACDSGSDDSARGKGLLKLLTSDVPVSKVAAELSLANTVKPNDQFIHQFSSILTKQQLLAHNQLKLMSNLDRKFSLPTAAYKTTTTTTMTTTATSKSNSGDSSSTSSASMSKESSQLSSQTAPRLEHKRGSLQLAFKIDELKDVGSVVDSASGANCSPSSCKQHDKKRKKSLPISSQNLENNSNNSDELVPYIIRRKFSNGQVKIQHSGKKYTKEEYNALKIELKKQSRKFSISSSIHA